MGLWWSTLVFLNYDRMSELAVNMFLKISIEKHLRPKTSRQNRRRKKAVLKNGFYHFFNRLVFYIYTLLSFMIDNWHYNKDYNKIDRWKEWQNKWKM